MVSNVCDLCPQRGVYTAERFNWSSITGGWVCRNYNYISCASLGIYNVSAEYIALRATLYVFQ